MSFDIETSSFYECDGVIYDNDSYLKSGLRKGVKKSIMYIWQFAINDNVIYGRTWGDYNRLCKALYKYLKLYDNRYIVVYVHNLSYEFQFIRNWFTWTDIFADSERKPIKAVNNLNFIYKCSYRLSGYSLNVLANNLQDGNLKKLIGNLDYDKIRNSHTPLTEKELEYCFNDVLIVTSYIRTMINEYGNIENIPLTQTGKVRRLLRSKCFANKKYRFFIEKLTIERLEYVMLQNAFMGGFTHCNAMYTDNILHDVSSFDFTSSYPTVLISEKYPCSKGISYHVNNEKELVALCNNYAVLVDVHFEKLESIFLYENILSYSKCRNLKNVLSNNGRIVKADSVAVTLTDVDFLNMRKFYKWEKLTIGLCYIYKKSYLPREIIQFILELYAMKTELKGVAGKEVEYLHGKELLNSVYGMCVTSIIHDRYYIENNKWCTENGDINSELKKYNTDKNRFLFYPWGVWCTAYARNNLYTAILTMKQDYIYADTDSVKILHKDKYTGYFERYNQNIKRKIKECLNFYGLNEQMATPKTIKGIEKPLGVWDYEGTYKTFKTLGAKRYMTEKENNLDITICGLSKSKGKEYIEKQEKPFIFFSEGMYIERSNTGKMTHTYIDNDIEGCISDYMGNIARYHEKSYIHLEKTDYLLSLTKMYIDYYRGIQNAYK